MEYLNKHELSQWDQGQVKGFSSSEIFAQNSANLKFLKIEPNSDYPVHLHPDKMEYAVIISGNPEISIADNNYSSSSGEVYIFPPLVKHSIKNKTNQVCILLIGSVKTDEQS